MEGGRANLERGYQLRLNPELGVTFSTPSPVGSPLHGVGPEKEPLSLLRGFDLPLSSLPASTAWSLTPQLHLPPRKGLEGGWVLVSSSTLLES